MDLFTAAGVETDSGTGGAKARRPGLARTLRVPLLNYRVVEEARQRAAFSPSPDQTRAAQDYARKASSPKFSQQKETSVRQLFFEEVLGRVLGYRTFDPEGY